MRLLDESVHSGGDLTVKATVTEHTGAIATRSTSPWISAISRIDHYETRTGLPLLRKPKQPRCMAEAANISATDYFGSQQITRCELLAVQKLRRVGRLASRSVQMLLKAPSVRQTIQAWTTSVTDSGTSKRITTGESSQEIVDVELINDISSKPTFLLLNAASGGSAGEAGRGFAVWRTNAATR